MRSNLVRTILVSLIIASTHSLVLPCVQAGSGLTLHGGYAQAPPIVDGNIQTGEWSAAATATFGPCTEEIAGTLYVMNDDKYLYVAVSFHGDDDFSEEDGFILVFDNDHGSETTIEEGDEILHVWGKSNFQDEFWHYEKIGGYDWHAMIDTPEGRAAGNRQGTLNEFELVHPLNSGEIGKDLSLSSGQIVGFSLWVHVDDCGNVCCAIPEGCAIGTMDPYYNPSVYANYVVASPAVLTPTVDMTVATTSNPITVTPHTASVGRTVMEPVPESSSSSRSIIWGVLVGLLFSSPIAIYRHMSQRRGDMRIGKKVLGVSRRRWQESLVVGQLVASFMIVGVIYLGTPDLVPEVRAFVSDFHLVEVLQNVWWYVPATINPVVLAATQEFCYAFGLVLIAVLGLKFAKRLSRRTETFLSMMFWLGAGYIVGLLSSGVLSWFSFLASLVIWTGVSIVGRALILVRRPAVK